MVFQNVSTTDRPLEEVRRDFAGRALQLEQLSD